MSSQKKKTQQENASIESTMKSIEKLLEALENTDTSLDRSLLAFEEGITLIRKAQEVLAKAEQKVQLLLEKDENPESTGFSLDGESG